MHVTELISIRKAARTFVLACALGAAPTAVFAEGDYDPVGAMQSGWALWAPDPATRNAQQILRDQGYYKGALDGTMNPEFRRAVWNFQRAQGLRRTVELDAPTVAALEKTTSGSASPVSR